MNDEPKTAHAAVYEREAVLRQAVKVWSGQLVDLSARNNLLFFRDLKVGTLDLTAVSDALVFDVLGGRQVSIRRLFPVEESRRDAVKRARALRNRAQEHFEERGLETLFLACGTATWTNQRGTATPCAPVFLVPARLTSRGAAQEEFELTITGELEVNPTLLQMLESDFNCRCDPEELLSAADIDGAVDTSEELEDAFRRLERRCATVPGFGITDRFVLGTFSYAKLPMVKDLESSVETLLSHDLIAALAGDDEARGAIRERRPSVDPKSPNYIPPADEFLVLDADASQNYAINAVLGGQDLVVKGPPGTGKSQTIANLISTLVARGKRVLFVAEKRAAIDAVLRRLEDVGLDDIVLDLHGGTGSRRVVAQALARALNTNATIARGDHHALHRALEARREELNSRVDALHQHRLPWGLSVYDAQGRLLELENSVDTKVRFRGAALDELGEDAYRQAREDLRTYVGLGGLTLKRSGSLWAAAEVVSSDEAAGAQALVEELRRHTLPQTLRALEAAAKATGLANARVIADWDERLALWQGVQKTLEIFEPEVFKESRDELVATVAPLSAGAGTRASARLTSADYRAGRKHLKALLRPGVRLPGKRLYEALQEAERERCQWVALEASAGGPLPAAPQDLDELNAAYEQFQSDLARLLDLLNAESLGESSEELGVALDALLADTVTLAKLPELHRLRQSLVRRGMSELLTDLSERRLGPERALLAFEFAWLWSFIERVRLTDRLIGAFDGEQHLRAVQEFRDADRRHIETTAHRVRRLCAEEAVRTQDQYATEAALIRDQAARKRKHLSVRQLFSAAPAAMLALKPCWAMSPLLVSQLLPNDQQYFDVVVFDEASQVRPADAIPAIARGKRVVVAGDEKQLPPTDFFTGSNPDVDAPELEGRIVVDEGFESILEALLPFIDFRMLRWHYRSRDERLIAFSNVYLYDRQLVTFPGVTRRDAIRHVLVPFQPEPGSEVSTSAEVEEVVRLIIEHAETRPDESLGVIAMGIKHADRIDEALRRALLDRDDINDFFDESKPERFFIKNLERVQGDERDAIILCQGSREVPRCDHGFSPPVIAGRSARMASRWARMR